MENLTEVKAAHIVNIIMAEHPEELRDDLDIKTVYKNPNVEVLTIIQSRTNQNAVAAIFGTMVTEGYMVTLKIPADDYASVMKSLENEPFVTKINGLYTKSGHAIEAKTMELAGGHTNYSTQNDEDYTPGCTMS